MPLFHVTAEVTISISTTVEAADKAEAAKIADSRDMQPLVSACYSGADEECEWCHSGELDGPPASICVTEAK